MIRTEKRQQQSEVCIPWPSLQKRKLFRALSKSQYRSQQSNKTKGLAPARFFFIFVLQPPSRNPNPNYQSVQGERLRSIPSPTFTLGR
jgi:hypothetical protein